jgi:hypothetical protein
LDGLNCLTYSHQLFQEAGIMFDELILRFHSVGHRYWGWAYKTRHWKKELESAAILCALQCRYLDFDEYPKEANRRIRILLRQLGYREKIGKDVLMPPDKLDLFEVADAEIDERLFEIEKLYENGFDYSKICERFGIWDINLRIEIRSLLRQCFNRMKN